MNRWVDLVRRGAWVALGLVAVGLGGVGIIVPGLPTTVFFIMAAACFAKSSPRLERWVLDLPKIGPAVERYRAGLGMPRRAKYWAIGMMLFFSMIAVWVIDLTLVRVTIVIADVIGFWYIGWRVPTTPDEYLEPAESG